MSPSKQAAERFVKCKDFDVRSCACVHDKTLQKY